MAEYQATSSFVQDLTEANLQGRRVCVGIDPNLEQIPDHVKKSADSGDPTEEALVAFSKYIIGQTKESAAVYKPNFGFFEQYGLAGWKALKRTFETIHEADRLSIADAKKGDIDNTAVTYARAIFEIFEAGAVTLNGYMGIDAVRPFMKYKDRGVFVLAKTSNPSSKNLQDDELYLSEERLYALLNGPVRSSEYTDEQIEKWGNKIPVWLKMTLLTSNHWNENGNLGLVFGATYPTELALGRSLAGDLPILIPGYGAQEGDLENTVKGALNSRLAGFAVNSSRGIIYAQDPEYAAMELNSRINNIIKPT